TTEKNYLKLLTESLPASEWRLICKRAIADAKKGDARARDWLSRCLGLEVAAQQLQIVPSAVVVLNIEEVILPATVRQVPAEILDHANGIPQSPAESTD